MSASDPTPTRRNIFIQMAEYMTRLESTTSGTRQVVEVGVASAFLQIFLGTDWCSRKIQPQAKPDEWMQNTLRSAITNTNWITYFHRLIRLADSLFTLLQSQALGLDVLRRRFHTRATKPCFIEAQIASLQSVNGFRVEIVGESGLRGKDFDLTARRDGLNLNIEVTGKNDAPISASTIRNTLKRKRTQLPATGPAILYMHVPADWMQNLEVARATFSTAFTDVFARSQRFNAVVLVWEHVLATPDGGTSHLTLWPCFNNNPRHAFDRLDLLNLPLDANSKPKWADSLYDFLKGVQSRQA